MKHEAKLASYCGVFITLMWFFPWCIIAYVKADPFAFGMSILGSIALAIGTTVFVDVIDEPTSY